MRTWACSKATPELLIFVAVVLVASCQRKAPGPSECRQFSRRALGIQDERALAQPELRARFDQLTDACLTTPYDRELVRCVAEMGPRHQCFVAFQRRQVERGAEEQQSPLPRGR